MLDGAVEEPVVDDPWDEDAAVDEEPGSELLLSSVVDGAEDVGWAELLSAVDDASAVDDNEDPPDVNGPRRSNDVELGASDDAAEAVVVALLASAPSSCLLMMSFNRLASCASSCWRAARASVSVGKTPSWNLADNRCSALWSSSS